MHTLDLGSSLLPLPSLRHWRHPTQPPDVTLGYTPETFASPAITVDAASARFQVLLPLLLLLLLLLLL